MEVASGETVNDDLYLFANEITVAGTVKGDVVAAGFTVDVPGRIEGDLIAAAANITVSGTVTGSIRAAGSTLDLGGEIGRDLVVAGGTIVAEPTARVGRDAWMAGATMDLQGAVGRNLNLITNNITLSATVGGDVFADTDSLDIHAPAVINGRVRHLGERDAQVREGARVGGKVDNELRSSDPMGVLTAVVRDVVGMFVFGLLFLLRPVTGLVDRSRRTLAAAPLLSGVVGIATSVGVPIAAVFLLVIGLVTGGWWIAALVIALYLMAWKVATILLALAIGPWLATRFGRPRLSPVLTLLIGVAALAVLGALPIIGGLVGFLAWWLGLGALVLTASQAIQPGRPGLQPQAAT